jgi:hypothetical protein
MITKWFERDARVLDIYKSADGWEMKREWGKTPKGNDLNGNWVLRNPDGEFIDFDGFRSDLMERHDFDIS